MACKAIAAAALLALGVSSPLVWADGSDDLSAMRQRMEQMERELSTMRQQVQEQANQIKQQDEQIRAHDEQAQRAAMRAHDVDALVRDVLADAERRTSLMAASGNASAGYNNGFFIASGDQFMLRLKGLLMIRYTYSHQEDSGNDDDRGGFELARTRFGFFGHVIDPSWQFVLWTGYNTEGGTALLDTYIKKVWSNGFNLTAGQYKLPFWREWLISETRLPLAERTLLNRYSGAYAQGVMLGYEKDALHAYFSLSDGLNATNTAALIEDTEGLAVTGRVEWLVTGKWAQYADAEAWPGEDPLVVLAGAVHYQNGEYGTSKDETEILRWTADATVKWQKLSVLGVLLGSHEDNSASTDQFGAFVQVGYFLTDSTEAHVRLEWGDSDRSGEDDLCILTIGLDHHWIKHQMRHVIDIGYAFNSVSSFYANPLAGYRPDAAGEDGQIVVRTQLELNF